VRYLRLYAWFMKMLACAAGLAAALTILVGCASSTGDKHAPASKLSGHLLIIGGGLDDDNQPVYDRFVSLARKITPTGAPPRVLIATAASGDQPANLKGKTESIGAYCPDCEIAGIARETTEAQTVALIDAAQAMFFTGGDQKRITTRYLKDGKDTPEAAAMRRLLARGGVIAGTSAGDAMMSDPMFLTGRSAEALGIASTRTQAADDDDADTKGKPPVLGPQIGQGMALLPWAVTDSHFFERHRFGRLVAALEVSGQRLGIGVGEDACVEVDLATGMLTGISMADSLLVDVGSPTSGSKLERTGLTRRNVRALVIRQGTTISLPARLAATLPAAPAQPERVETVTIVEPGQNRQLASWRFFLRAQTPPAPGTPLTAIRLQLDGYRQTAWPDGSGWSVVEIGPFLNQ